MKLKTEFQDEDFKLGEVADVNIATMPDGRIKAQAVAKSGGVHTFFYDDLKTFTDDWEDYEEPKEYWHIFGTNITKTQECLDELYDKRNKEIGNYFDSREEAEKAVEKLKAFKRLKDKGFRFEGIKQDYTRFFSQQKPIRIGRKYLQFNKAEDEEWLKENCEDLDLLFGGEG